VVGRQNADIADTLATIFGFLCMGCALVPPVKYDWTVNVWWQCGLMSNYFDHLLQFIYIPSVISHCGLGQ